MKKAHQFTKSEDDFLKENYLEIPIEKLARLIGCSSTGIKGRMRKMKLVIPRELAEKRKKEGQFQKGNRPTNKGKKIEHYMSAEGIENSSKTRFKKGHSPHNTKEKNGVISIRRDHKNRTGRKYKYIRIALGKWKPLHVYLWESKNGTIAEGFCLWFRDGDSLNCRLSNLELISRKENLKRNRKKYLELPEEVKKSIFLINKIKKMSNGKTQ